MENRLIAKEALRRFRAESIDTPEDKNRVLWVETAARNSSEMRRLLENIVSLGEESEELRRHKVYALAHRNLGLYFPRSVRTFHGPFPAYLEESVGYLKTALRLGLERDRKVTRRLGAAYYQSGNFREAVEPLKQSVEADPNDDVARYHLCLTYLSLHETEKAKEQYEALRLRPGSINYHLAKMLEPMMYRTARQLSDAERDELEEMLKSYRRVKE